MNFTWKPFFHELFLKAVTEYDSKSLALLAYKLFPESAMMDRDDSDNEVRFEELDPCTFLARFNRQERVDRKIEYCKKAKELMAIKSQVPTDFGGIPIFNNMRWQFVPFKKDREGFEYEALWNFSRKLADGEITADTLNAARKSFGAGLTYLTTISYIVWPEKYLPLDDRTKSYLEKRSSELGDLIEKAKKSNEPYLIYSGILQKLPSVVPNKNCADISLSAYLEDDGKSEVKLLHNKVESNGVHYWSIAPGENADYWDDWQQKKLISIGWNDLGDLSKVDTLDDVGKLYKEKYKPENSAKNNILANFEFAHRLKENDIVFVKNGRTELLGVGRVTSGYKFDKSEVQSHTRKVEWLSAGEWTLKTDKFAIKTLTDITEYVPFVEYLFKLSGLNDPSTTGGLVEKAKKPSLSKNTIFWGPPGTGKTYKLLQLQDEFRDVASSSDEIISWVQELGWWEVIAATMIDLKKPVSVPEIFNHEFLQAKIKQQSNKTPKNTIWGQLQMHTIQDSKTVKFERRQEPLVVDKSDDSTWELVGDWKDQLDDLSADVKRIRTEKGTTTSERFNVVTFHQSYSYEEFVEGIRPEIQADGSGVSYQVKDGVFKKLCQRANENPEKNYAIFIDEINRGNISKIFGELITLIEEDKRLGAPHEVTITLPYSGQKFGVPSNLYVIGTMNSVDRSIALVDMALRRRFDFVAIRPNSSLISNDGIKEFNVRSVFEKLNNKISVILGTEYQVGHSYFMDKHTNSLQSFKRVWFGSILPLLQEYLFDDWDKLHALVGDFVRKTDVKDLESLSLPKFSFGSFVENDISDNSFVEIMKKLE